MNKMKAEYFFPLLLIALDVGAASVYAFSGDIKKGGVLDCRRSIECMRDFLGGVK
jgi:hypothetical protein